MIAAPQTLLSRIAEDALRERGFLPHPPAQAVAEDGDDDVATADLTRQ